MGKRPLLVLPVRRPRLQLLLDHRRNQRAASASTPRLVSHEPPPPRRLPPRSQIPPRKLKPHTVNRMSRRDIRKLIAVCIRAWKAQDAYGNNESTLKMSERHPRNIYTNLLMSYIRHYFHIVFSTKYRQPLISQKIEKTVYHLIYSQIIKYQGYVHRINGMPDHIHILASFPPKYPHSEVIKIIKQETSKNIKSLGIIPSWNGWEE